MRIGKIFVRSLVGILTVGVVTILVGSTVIPEVLVAMFLAIGGYVYLDRELSGDPPNPQGA